MKTAGGEDCSKQSAGARKSGEGAQFPLHTTQPVYNLHTITAKKHRFSKQPQKKHLTPYLPNHSLKEKTPRKSKKSFPQLPKIPKIPIHPQGSPRHISAMPGTFQGPGKAGASCTALPRSKRRSSGSRSSPASAQRGAKAGVGAPAAPDSSRASCMKQL